MTCDPFPFPFPFPWWFPRLFPLRMPESLAEADLPTSRLLLMMLAPPRLWALQSL